MIARAAAAASGATQTSSFPSLATNSGSRPRIAQAPATAGVTGRAASSRTMATSDWRATSLRVVATPPRVGSRSTCTAAPSSASSSATSSCSGAQSETIGEVSVQPLAGGQHRHAVVAEGAVDQHPVTGAGAAPVDLQVMLQHADAGGIDEQLVGLAARHHLGVAGDDLHAAAVGGGAQALQHLLQVGRPPALPRGSGRR